MSTSPGLNNWVIPFFSYGLMLVSSCQSLLPEIGRDPANGVDCVEAEPSRSFLEICRKLNNPDGFRQNVWLGGELADSAAICMDLDRRLYLLFWSNAPALEQRQIDEKFKRLLVEPDVLSSRMAPDAFILDGGSADERLIGVFSIPDNAGESFGIDLINRVLNLDLKLKDQSFQWG